MRVQIIFTYMIDKIALMKEIRLKKESQDWFDGEINEEIETELFAELKKSRL